MSELNEKQQLLCDSTDGFVIVDAGPGTGKTHSIVQRYINIIQKGVDPMEVLMLTFTRNAADEMQSRISAKMSKCIVEGDDPGGLLRGALENLKISTIDSLCLDVVLNSPEIIRDFFDPDDMGLMLSRSASLSENETLNRQYFSEFYARFMKDHGSEYVIDGIDYAAIIGDDHMDLYELIQNLMARGIIPRKKGWFVNDKDLLIGRPDEVLDSMRANAAKVYDRLKKIRGREDYVVPDGLMAVKSVPDEYMEEAANDDREGLLRIVHDAYFNYISYCIKENRLTFGLCELFALIILMRSESSRHMHSVEYLTIDEFQDTNELQMKICLLLLERPNMCVVGDWKQGIFGFRYVTIRNITEFGTRVKQFMRDLEDNRIEFPFTAKEPLQIEFDRNYRSTGLILKHGFDSLDIPGSDGDDTSHGNVVPLIAMKEDFYGGRTGVNCILAETKEKEVQSIVDMITEYVCSGRYEVVDEDDDHNPVVRKAEFGDIAVLCRSSAYCTSVFSECENRRIPAFLQGDIEVMSSEEGKLALAWLRYLNNQDDRRGLVAILDHLNYPLNEIEAIVGNKALVPSNITDQLSNLRQKKKRINNLITSIFDFYGMNNDITQTIINVLSSAHKGSLMTVSDMIRLIEDDISAGTKYNVEPLIDRKAVKIQTIHKSKGLEYPIVIVAGVIKSSFPSVKQGDSILRFDDNIGVRCTRTYVRNPEDGGHEVVINDWKTALVRSGYPIDYSEERRLLFVALTRAKQYVTITSYDQKNGRSKFFDHYFGICPRIVPEGLPVDRGPMDCRTPRPVIAEYERKRMSISAHDLMSVMPEPPGIEKREGKGKEYGDMVHEMAYLYLKWHKKDDSVEEMEYISGLIDERKDTRLSGEIRCVLPVDDVSIKGTIDLLAEYDDRFEIHDYKTDVDDRYLDRYRLQLSVYYYTVQPLGKKVDCFVDFVSLKESIRIEPYPMDYIRELIAEYKRRSELPV